MTQSEKGHAFRKLHERDGAFIIPNPWNIGTARMLAHLGFEALATTSMGYALSVGQRDGTLNRDQALEHARAVVAATDLPVSADLENGFGDAPDVVAETFRRAAAVGLAGGSIEDSTGRPDHPIYELEHAVERVRAAVEVVRSLPFPFMLTARAENYLHGRSDLKDTIRRLQAYQQAGAGVLFAPGLKTKADIVAVVTSVDLPVNVLMGMQGIEFSLADLAAMGVKRVSIGSSLCRASFGAFLRGAREMKEHGTFNFSAEATSPREISAMLDEN